MQHPDIPKTRDINEIKRFLASLPGFADLAHPPVDMPYHPELEEWNARLDAELTDMMTEALKLDEMVNRAAPPASAGGAGASATAPKPSPSTALIAIRVPRFVLDAYRRHAESHGVGYQTLMNRSLKSAMSAWVNEASAV